MPKKSFATGGLRPTHTRWGSLRCSLNPLVSWEGGKPPGVNLLPRLIPRDAFGISQVQCVPPKTTFWICPWLSELQLSRTAQFNTTSNRYIHSTFFMTAQNKIHILCNHRQSIITQKYLHCIHEEQTSVWRAPVADCQHVARNHLRSAVSEVLSMNYAEYVD